MIFKAVLFDLGGTLIHYHDPEETDLARPFRRVTMLGIKAVMEQVASSGASLPPAEEIGGIVDKHIGTSFRTLIEKQLGGTVETPVRAALGEMGIALSDAGWGNLRPAFYSAINQIASPRVGGPEMLAGLAGAGIKLGLISNTFWAADLHDQHLVDHGLIEHLPVRVYSCDFGYSKPHPSIFQHTLEKLGVDAADAVYVGDRPDADVGGSQSAGMRGVLIRSPYENGQYDGIMPDATIDELPDLPAAIAGW